MSRPCRTYGCNKRAERLIGNRMHSYTDYYGSTICKERVHPYCQTHFDLVYDRYNSKLDHYFAGTKL